jgi:HTH-type transcriptional regulator, sugar sensing transcriptional regulator
MQIADLAAKLESLGLSDKEAKVYVANLFLGPSPVQRIAEQAGVNRATAYVILDQLASLGLVAESNEGKKTTYVAEGPEALERHFDAQESLIAERRAELKVLIPELQGIDHSDQVTAPVVRFYQGPEGIKSALGYLRRKANPKSTVYGLANWDEVERVAAALEGNRPHRLKKKISSKVIYSYTKGEIPSGKALLKEARRVEQPVKADLNLYEDAAALVTYAGKDSVAVVIENPEIVGALRQLFEIAWDSDSK